MAGIAAAVDPDNPVAQAAPVTPAKLARISLGSNPGMPSGSTSGGVNKPIDYSAILSQFGKDRPAAAAPMTNTSSANPDLTYANDKLKGLYDSGGNVDALGRQAAGAIRDDAENLRKGARDSAAARGVSGGGVEGLANSAIDREVLSSQAKARVGIANDWEARKQGVLRDVAGNAVSDEGVQNTQRNTALNQQNLQFQQTEGAKDNDLRRFGTVLDLFGSPDLFGVGSTA